MFISSNFDFCHLVPLPADAWLGEETLTGILQLHDFIVWISTHNDGKRSHHKLFFVPPKSSLQSNNFVCFAHIRKARFLISFSVNSLGTHLVLVLHFTVIQFVMNYGVNRVNTRVIISRCFKFPIPRVKFQYRSEHVLWLHISNACFAISELTNQLLTTFTIYATCIVFTK